MSLRAPLTVIRPHPFFRKVVGLEASKMPFEWLGRNL